MDQVPHPVELTPSVLFSPQKSFFVQILKHLEPDLFTFTPAQDVDIECQTLLFRS